MSVKPFDFFKQVTYPLGFSLSESGNQQYVFLDHKLKIGNVLLQNYYSNELFTLDPSYFLVTKKILIREKFFRILLELKVELLNDLFQDSDPLIICKIQRDYSFRMKDDSNIEQYNMDDFMKNIKIKFNSFYKEFNDAYKTSVFKVKKKIDGKLVLLTNENQKKYHNELIEAPIYEVSVDLMLDHEE